VTNIAFTDVAAQSNNISPISIGLGIGPVLFRTTIDMDAGLLALRFSEPVVPSTLQADNVVIQSIASNAATSTYTLTGTDATWSRHGSYTVMISITDDDMNALKIITDLCSDVGSTFIALRGDAVEDPQVFPFMGPNPSLANAVGIQVSEFTTDTTPPSLVSWTLDLAAATLTMTFDEPVKSSTFGATQITLENQQIYDAATTASVTLTAGSTTSSANGVVIILNIENAGGIGNDFDEIGYARGLATELSTTYVSFTTDIAIDMSTNQASQVLSPSVHSVLCPPSSPPPSNTRFALFYRTRPSRCPAVPLSKPPGSPPTPLPPPSTRSRSTSKPASSL